MEDCTRVLLYGTFDGFTYSTDDLPQITVVFDGGERVEVPEECVVSADQMVNKYKIRLKDVIERIEKFDLGTKAVWINEILNKLGSEYGFHKYCEGYKQGKFDGIMKREKVTVPQFVADWIEECKNDDFHLFGAMEGISSNQKKLDYWFREDDNMELFARAWLNGYEVKSDKKYTVKITKTGQYLYCVDNDFTFVTYIRPEDNPRSYHTKKQLEEAGFSNVFVNPIFEVKEVK